MPRITRRTALKTAAATLAAPFVWRHHAHAAPSETVLHASFGAGGMAGADIGSLTASKNLKLVAVADVDANRSRRTEEAVPRLPRLPGLPRAARQGEGPRLGQRLHARPHARARSPCARMQRGLHVYTQKPLTQTIHEARRLAEVAAEKKLVTQMGIQIHSHRDPQARGEARSTTARSAR